MSQRQQLRLVFSNSNDRSPNRRTLSDGSKPRRVVSSVCLRLHRKVEALHAENPEVAALVERLVDDMLAPAPFPWPRME